MRLAGIWFAIAVAGYVACATASSATEEDRARLAALRSEFSDRYEFAFQEPLYVRARIRTGSPTEDEATRIFDSFWRPDGKTYRKSSYVYLNVYDEHGRFVTQVYYDPAVERTKFSQREFY